MKCAGCPQPANADVARYGKLWCTSCVTSIEFEERLASQNGMAVVDVFVNDAGHLVVALEEKHPGQSINSERIALTEADVLRELIDAAAALRRTVIFTAHGVRLASPDARGCARRFLDIAAKYDLILGPAERESTTEMQRLARLILSHPVEATN